MERGEVLENRSTHPFERTTVVGFCFTADPPREAIRWLAGTVETDYCVTFDAPEEMLTEGIAEYRDPDFPAPPISEYPSNNVPKIRRKEYGCTKYSIHEFHVMHYTRAYSNIPGHSIIREILRKKGFEAHRVDKSDLL